MRPDSSDQDEHDDIEIIRDEVQPAQTVWGRWIRFLGDAILWALALGPGVLVLWYGINGILSQELILISRRGWVSKKLILGSDAVGWSWCFVGIGIWALGQGLYLKTEKPFWKLLGLVLALVPAGIGAMVLLKKLVS